MAQDACSNAILCVRAVTKDGKLDEATSLYLLAVYLLGGTPPADEHGTDSDSVGQGTWGTRHGKQSVIDIPAAMYHLARLLAMVHGRAGGGVFNGPTSGGAAAHSFDGLGLVTMARRACGSLSPEKVDEAMRDLFVGLSGGGEGAMHVGANDHDDADGGGDVGAAEGGQGMRVHGTGRRNDERRNDERRNDERHDDDIELPPGRLPAGGANERHRCAQLAMTAQVTAPSRVAHLAHARGRHPPTRHTHTARAGWGGRAYARQTRHRATLTRHPHTDRRLPTRAATHPARRGAAGWRANSCNRLQP